MLVPPSRDGPPPVGLIGERRPLRVGDILAPLHQSRTRTAHRHRAAQLANVVDRVRQPEHVWARLGDRRLRGCGIAGPAGSLRHGGRKKLARDRVRQQVLRHALCHALDQAIPSRMSASDTSIESTVVHLSTRSRISAPAPITSARPGCMNGNAIRSVTVIRSSRSVAACTAATGRFAWWILSRWYDGRSNTAAATVVIVPATPMNERAVRTRVP